MHLQLLHLLYKGLPLCSELAHFILGHSLRLHHEQPFTPRHRQYLIDSLLATIT